MADPVINVAALEPLFGPSDVPNRHRVRAKQPGQPAEIVQGRRPSPIKIVQNLREQVATWRESHYAGVSDTSRELLYHWFHTEHRVGNRGSVDLNPHYGESVPFAYYFASGKQSKR
jgi:type III restriction enzyme